MAKKKFKKIVEWTFGDYWFLLITVNGVFAIVSYILLLVDNTDHFIPLLLSGIVTILILPFIEIRRKVIYEEL